MMPNVPQYPVAVAAVLRAGLVVVNVNPLYTPRELEHQLKDSGAKAIIVMENFAATLAAVVEQVPSKTVLLASMGDMLGWARGRLVNHVVRHVKKLVPAYRLAGVASVHTTRFNDALAAGRRMRLAPSKVGPDDIVFIFAQRLHQRGHLEVQFPVHALAWAFL